MNGDGGQHNKTKFYSFYNSERLTTNSNHIELMQKKSLPTLLRFVFIGSLCLLVAGCGSTKENTAKTRFWQAFVTRFNVYHNGNEAYKEGMQAQEKGHMDNYMYPIHLYCISSPTTQKTAAGNFDTAIEKAQKASKLHSIKTKPKRKSNPSPKEKAFYAKKEFNPFMHNVWLLMAKAQFQKGEFLEAATTFAYTARLFSDKPKVVAECRMRMAQCYAELDWTYEAENLFVQAKRDSIPYQLADEYEALYASYLLEHERFEEALPHLEKAVKRSGRSKKQKAREYYLLGQIYALNGQSAKAYHSFQKAINQNPPYQLEFNARIQQTEVVEGKTAPKLIKSLKKMAKDPNNKDYLDQVYYAMGNVYMAQSDTIGAIHHYERGAKESTRNGIEKGVLLLHLGNIYWERTQYGDAQRCYAEAVGLIDKDSKEFPQLNKRSSILDGLVEQTNAINLQDSLQALAKMPEEQLYKVIDGIIAEVNRKEAEEKAKAEQEKRQQRREQLLSEAKAGTGTMKNPQMTGGDNAWYFYNTMLVTQGKKDFQEKWGRRKLEDNWRRSNKSVLADATFEETDYSEEEEDEKTPTNTVPDSAALAAKADSLANDIHNRAYYLKQIPFTDEQLAASNGILQEALYNAGVIYKDKLEDFSLAESDFGRLMQQFPGYAGMAQVYYHLYLMYSRWHRTDMADTYKALLTEQFPESEYALTVNNPEFKENALYGKHREDSLYAAAYTAYSQGRFDEVHAAATRSAEKYAMGAHRPKFMFLDAMSNLQQGDQSQFLEQLKDIVAKYPQNEISELAGLIAQGMQDGRLLTSGSLGTIWSRRLSAGTGGGTTADAEAKPFTDDRYAPHIFMLAYEEGTVNDNQLLFEMARYNFTNFMVRNFEITTDRKGGIVMLRVSGFMNYDEAWHYHRRLYADNDMSTKLSGIRSLLISEANLALLLESHSFDDYATFYDEHFGQLPGLEDSDGSTLDDVLFDDNEEEEPAADNTKADADQPDF